MKVMLISQDFYPLKGGIASYLLGIYKEYFSQVDFEVITPFLGSKKNLEKLPFKVHQTSFSPFKLNKERESNNEKILETVIKFNPDILLFGYIRSHPEVAQLYKKFNPNLKWGIFLHGKEVFLNSSVTKRTHVGKSQKGYTKKEVLFYKKILNAADILFTVSAFTKNLLLIQGIKKKVKILSPHIDVKRSILKKNAKKILGLNGKLILLSVGRLILRKNQKAIISLLPNLLKHFPNLHYLIVGDGPEKSNLKKLIKKNSLGKNVTIYSKVTEERLGLFYSACDLFVLPCIFIKPNDTEGFGIVFLEAGSYSKPVIGGNIGGVSEAILNKKTGYLVNDSNKDLKKRIFHLLANKKLRNLMGVQGRARVIKKFNFKKSNSLLREIISTSR